MFRLFRCAAALLLLAAAAFAAEPQKFIRLRNGRITTTPAQAAAVQPADSARVSGLVLIQFETAPTPEQRQQLTDLGVDLLSYVPDDAFIADANQVPPGKLRALSFIRWVGPFRPEHKIHGKLADSAAAKAAIEKKAAGAKITKVETLTKGGKTTYEAAITKGKKTSEITVAADGSAVK